MLVARGWWGQHLAGEQNEVKYYSCPDLCAILHLTLYGSMFGLSWSSKCMLFLQTALLVTQSEEQQFPLICLFVYLTGCLNTSKKYTQ